MSDELEDDPEARALRPTHSKRTLIGAVVAGVGFGLVLALASFVFEQHIPRFGAPRRPDAGAPTVPDIGHDAGPRASPWLDGQ